MVAFFKKYKLSLIGLMAGALTGIVYWHFEGCPTGTCMITSSPVRTVSYFSVVGILFFNIFKSSKND